MSNSRSATASGGRGGAGGRGRRDGGHLEVIPFRPHRAWWVQALLVAWRWLFELLFLLALVWLIAEISDRTGLSWQRSTLTVLAVMVLPFVIPQVRRVLVALFWVGVCRHRLRAFFIECRVFNRSGKLPWIVAATPIPVGERVWLWLVPGLSVEDFEHRAEDISAACWATTARIERHRRYAFLVRVDVVRRDPLTSGGVLPSTLVPAGAETEHSTSGHSAQAGPLDLPRQVVDLAASTERVERKPALTAKPGKPATGRAVTAAKVGTVGQPAPVSRGGEDVSDYV